MVCARAKLTAIAVATFFATACGGPPRVGPVSSSVPPGRVVGALEWPIRGALVSPYRPASRPSHAGVDLAAPPGTTVIAAEAGEVVYAGHIQGYGGVLAITHAGELTTVYAHLGDVRAVEHARVRRGEAIAAVGDSGYLHYEIRRAKQPIDPAELYAIGPSPSGTTTARADVTAEPAEDVPIEPKRVSEPTREEPRREVARAEPPRAEPARVEPPRAEAARTEPARTEPEPAPLPPPAPLPARDETALADTPAAPSTQSHGALGATIGTSSSPAPSEPAPIESAGDGASTPLVVGANLFYVPAKLGYAGLGAVTGVLVLGLSQNPTAAGRLWTQTMGGDYLLSGEQVGGDEPVHFMGTPDRGSPSE